MKKTYKKPIANVEFFTLTQNIAQGCGYKDENFIGFPTHADNASCGWNDGSGEIYWTSKPQCGDAYSPDLEIGEVCYNNPNGAATIFAS